MWQIQIIMNVPQEVKNAARDLIDQYGESFDYLGNLEGQEAYLFCFPEETTIGFPVLYLFKDEQAIEITGPKVFDFIDLYIKDVEEVYVE